MHGVRVIGLSCPWVSRTSASAVRRLSGRSFLTRQMPRSTVWWCSATRLWRARSWKACWQYGGAWTRYRWIWLRFAIRFPDAQPGGVWWL